MRSRFLAVVVVLLASIAMPALAAAKHKPSKRVTPDYNNCEALAVERGTTPGQGPNNNPEAHFNAFMRACLAGKLPR